MTAKIQGMVANASQRIEDEGYLIVRNVLDAEELET